MHKYDKIRLVKVLHHDKDEKEIQVYDRPGKITEELQRVAMQCPGDQPMIPGRTFRTYTAKYRVESIEPQTVETDAA